MAGYRQCNQNLRTVRRRTEDRAGAANDTVTRAGGGSIVVGRGDRVRSPTRPEGKFGGYNIAGVVIELVLLPWCSEAHP